MDELLSFMEEDDFGGGSDDGGDVEVDPRIPDPTCRRMTLSPLKQNSLSLSPASKTQQNVTFKDIFGSPDKRDVKELGLSQDKVKVKASSQQAPVKKFDLSSSRSSLSSGGGGGAFGFAPFSSSSQQQLSRSIREDSKVPYKPESSLGVLDPYSRVRLVKTSISIYYDETMTPEAALKDRNCGMEFVDLASFSFWYRGKGKDQKNFWVSGVLVRKTTSARKSANGNDYLIWELSDLRDLDKKTTVFLFGSAAGPASSLSGTPVGSVIDITTPSVMQDAGGVIKLSVKNSNQVRLIATAKDFGFCGSTKKDGQKCTAPVNTWECSFCIHHASAELKKLNVGGAKKGGGAKGGKGRGQGQGNNFPNKSFGGEGGGGGYGGESQESLKQQGVFIANFGGGGARPGLGGGGGATNRSFGKKEVKVTSRPILPPSSRMALQGGVNTMNKNPVKFGNPETVTFFNKGGGEHPLLKQEAPPPVVKKPLDLNPNKTRHLTDKDRELLLKLEAMSSSQSQGSSSSQSQQGSQQSQSQDDAKKPLNKKQKTEASAPPVVSELITASIVNNPNAASRNFLQFLSLQHAPKEQVDLDSSKKSSSIQPLAMSRAKLKCMEKALDFVKKTGPIKKLDPNAPPGKNRRSTPSSSGASSSSSQSKKRSRTQIDVEFDFDSEDFKKILNAKSAHDEELDDIQIEENFSHLEKKEALENKLLNTFSIETNAVMCRQCKYVALSQGDFCKEQLHQVRLVKARKRFFKCKDCGNRTMSLDRLPKRPCPNCNNSNWLVAPVGKERKGPMLPSEMLAIRGNEEKFIGSAGSKMFLNLEV